jgi:DUF1707 SHOCT-like domain
MCHPRSEPFRDQSDEAPVAADPTLRASDADRERVVAALREHSVAGRLTVEELEDRSASAYAARTFGELEPLLADLPPAGVRAWSPPARARRPIVQFAALTALLIVIWAATGAGYFWPMWPLLGWFWFGFAGPRARRRRYHDSRRGWHDSRALARAGRAEL